MTGRLEAAGSAAAPPSAGRRERIRRVREQMAHVGVDALLLSHGADLPWLTGYRAMPLERLTMFVLRTDADPVLLVPALEAPRVADSHGLFEVRAWNETEDPVELVARLLPSGARAASSAAGRGEHATYAVSDRAWAQTLIALQGRLPTARWMPASTVTSPLRAVKDAEEIAVLRAAAAAADSVARALQAGEVEVVGRTEEAVSAEIAARLVAAGHRRVNFSIVGSGPNGASPHHDASGRLIGPGDTVVCDFGGEFPSPDGVAYCSDITRTVSVGDPSPEVDDCYAVLEAAQAAAVAAVAPGVTAEHVDAVARQMIADAGFGDFFIHRTGHGIGIEEHEDPYIVAGNGTPLVPGHAFSIEPGIYFPGRFGMRLEDIVVVCEDGVDPLNRVDHSLAVVA
ncbi:MAG TPA: aminopeptidase P family protein [Acidimicrobiales bacterium]|nr:aminopeptidase P family protein [Acidimicrobiales bacterium]